MFKKTALITAVEVAAGRTKVSVPPLYFRPAEIGHFARHATKARSIPGWRHEVTFRYHVAELADAARETRVFEVA